MPLQRSAHIGALTDSSYVQLVGQGVAAIDLGFPTRYTHSSLEVCDLADLEALTRLLVAALARIDRKFSLDRDDYDPMKHYLGIDIGTFELKGVLVDETGRIVGERGQAAQDDRAAARLGRAPAARGLVGRFHLHQPQAPCGSEAPAPVDQGGRMQCHRPLHAARRRRRRAAHERHSLWRRRPRGEGDRRADGGDRRGRAPRPLRQRPHLAVCRPEDPLAEAEPAGDLFARRA